MNWRYEKGSKDILDGFSSVKKGGAIGIFGESGAGKSTITDIIFVYFAQQGEL